MASRSNPLPAPGDKVYDAWWPWNVGTVTKVNTRSVYITWVHPGHSERYDHPHARQFLRLYAPRKKRK